jgi:hypothetical protein
MTATLRRSGRHPSDGDRAGFAAAGHFARDLTTEIADAAEPGMSDHDLTRLVKARFEHAGVRRHRHIPVIGSRLGSAKLRSIRSPYLVSHRRAAKHEELIVVARSDVLRLDAEHGL